MIVTKQLVIDHLDDARWAMNFTADDGGCYDEPSRMDEAS